MNYKSTTLVVATTAVLLLASPAIAGTKHAAPDTPATDFHGLPGNNPGFGENNASANPNGNGVNGGNGIHDIDQNPGQSGNRDPANDGDQPAEDMHGGLDVGHD